VTTSWDVSFRRMSNGTLNGLGRGSAGNDFFLKKTTIKGSNSPTGWAVVARYRHARHISWTGSASIIHLSQPGTAIQNAHNPRTRQGFTASAGVGGTPSSSVGKVRVVHGFQASSRSGGEDHAHVHAWCHSSSQVFFWNALTYDLLGRETRQSSMAVNTCWIGALISLLGYRSGEYSEVEPVVDL